MLRNPDLMHDRVNNYNQEKHLSSKPSYLQVQDRHCHLLYNPELLDIVSPDLLSLGIFQQADECQPVASGGRGQAWFIKLGELSAVLRSYQRGGMLAKLNRQSYLGYSVENSRSFKEWRLLQSMHEKSLPVPRPVAASVCRWPLSFSPLYRAHILIERIEGSQTFDQLLSMQAEEVSVWRSIGHCIRHFHDENIYHADLNANNILLNSRQKVYLIDFDKCEIRSNSQQDAQWKKDNLQRLQRSLLKQQSLHQNYYYSDENWAELIAAYDEKA